MVIIRDDPARSARLIANELGADLVVGGAAATAALARLSAEPAEPPADLTQLSTAMRRAERVLERTRARTAQHLARSLNTDLAIHPETLHRAATELCQVDDELRRARRGHPATGPVLGTTTRAVVAVTVATGTFLAVANRPLAGIPLAVAGVLGAALAHLVATRRTRSKVPSLEVQEASARRRWEQLAGAGGDPTDVEAVIYRYDPRQQMVADLVGHHPAVRAAHRAARARRTAWVRAWCVAVGDPYQPPESDELDGLSGPGPGPAPSPADGGTLGHRATLVVAAPYADLSDADARRLHHRFLTLPAGPRVIVVLGPDSRLDEITNIDLTEASAAVDLTDAATDPDHDQADALRGGGLRDP